MAQTVAINACFNFKVGSLPIWHGSLPIWLPADLARGQSGSLPIWRAAAMIPNQGSLYRPTVSIWHFLI